MRIIYRVIINKNMVYAYIPDDQLNKLQLPTDLKVLLSSFSFNDITLWHLKLLEQIILLLDQYWNIEYGVPEFKFIDKVTSDIATQVYFLLYDGLKTEDLYLYKNAVRYVGEPVLVRQDHGLTLLEGHRSINSFIGGKIHGN